MKKREHLRLVRGTLTEAAATSMEPPDAPTAEETATTSMVAETVLAVRDDWIERACNRIGEIGKLQPGWDGYGADPIPEPTLTFASILLGHVCTEASALAFPAITPMSNGAVMIEWRTRTHELTVEVNNMNDVDVLFEILATGRTTEFHITSDFSKISDALEQSTKPAVAAA